MHLTDCLDRKAALSAAVAGILLAVAPVLAQSPGSTAAGTPSPQTSSAAPACEVDDASLDHFAHRLTRTARVIAAGKPLKIVAIGSSSTAGSGASTSAASYPSRLEVELTNLLPGEEITVLNRGVGGEETGDMLARFQTGVLAEKPDLVIWQVGTNSVLRDHPLQPHLSMLHGGIVTLKETGADIVLIDPQYAPRVIAKANAQGMVDLIAETAKRESVDLFPRFAIMQHWLEADGLTFDAMLSPDQLHMNDWSYACLAKWLGTAIAEAATRPTETARAPQVRR